MIGSITRGCSRRCIPAAASSALDFYPSLVASNHSLRTMTTGGLSTLRLTAWCGKIAGAKRRGLSPLARGYSSSMASFASHGILERMRSVLGTDKVLGPSTAIFHNCKDRADSHEWYSKGLVKSDFRSRHAILMLHIWMVHRRLIEGSVGGSSAVDPSKAVPNYKAVQEALFDFLWEDTCNRIRNQKVNEMSVNKYLKEVQAFSFKMCIELDQSVKMPSEDEILMDIGGAIWRSVFDRSEAVEDDHVMEFAKYIRREQLSLIDISADNILQGKFAWGDFPAWKVLPTSAIPGRSQHREGKGGDSSSGSSSQLGNAESQGLPENWRTAVAQDGRLYYWNVITREARWDKPTH